MFRIMTLNLRFGLADDGKNGWAHRRQAYPALFSAHPADLYCFQEANGFQIADLAACLPGHRVVGVRRPAPPFWQHNPIFVPRSWRIGSWERIYLSATPEIPSRQRSSKWPRQCTIAHLRFDGGGVICVNTHFDFAPETQRESARIISGRLQRCDRSVPCVVAGDFNAVPGGGCHRMMTGDGWIAGRRFRSAFGAAPPGSYHGFRGIAEDRHIDWILIDERLRAVSAAAVDGSFGGVFPSDHYPMTAALATAPA